jgi:hypothetical protein
MSVTNREKIYFYPIKEPNIHQHVAVSHNVTVLIIFAGVVQLRKKETHPNLMDINVWAYSFKLQDIVVINLNVSVCMCANLDEENRGEWSAFCNIQLQHLLKNTDLSFNGVQTICIVID